MIARVIFFLGKAIMPSQKGRTAAFSYLNTTSGVATVLKYSAKVTALSAATFAVATALACVCGSVISFLPSSTLDFRTCLEYSGSFSGSRAPLTVSALVFTVVEVWSKVDLAVPRVESNDDLACFNDSWASFTPAKTESEAALIWFCVLAKKSRISFFLVRTCSCPSRSRFWMFCTSWATWSVKGAVALEAAAPICCTCSPAEGRVKVSELPICCTFSSTSGDTLGNWSISSGTFSSISCICCTASGSIFVICSATSLNIVLPLLRSMCGSSANDGAT
mmetsp:Transcript_10100/g.15325  ORF Transcript_10100/g.15325 Transcript_10100/m.15325 type:complete len:278 (+) Transcript_10100:632-1465(+)